MDYHPEIYKNIIEIISLNGIFLFYEEKYELIVYRISCAGSIVNSIVQAQPLILKILYSYSALQLLQFEILLP